MKANALQWEKVLSRWATAPDSGERRLMIALLAHAMTDEIKKWATAEDVMRDPYFRAGWGSFDKHVSLIGVDPQFAREQMLRFAPEAVAA